MTHCLSFSLRKASSLLVSSLLLLITAFAPQVAHGQDTWGQQSPATNPSARYGFGFAYDSLHQQVVMFGGEIGGNDQTGVSETWVWDGSNWTQLSPATNPPPRGETAMVYDSVRQQVVLFGGISPGVGGKLLNDTWVWDGTTWTQKFPATSPPARDYYVAAFDELHQQMVIYGGGGSTGILTDTWVWDGANWTQMSPSTSPPARRYPSAAYDSARQNVVLFGGLNQSSGFLGDTWLWDGTNWTQAAPLASPSARIYPELAYDPASQQVILFSGDGGFPYATDTWAWNGATWTQLSPSVSPPAHIESGMVFDAAQQGLVMFGGANTVLLNDTWLFETQPTVTITVPAGIQFSFNGLLGLGTQTITIAPGTYTLSTNSPQATGTGTQAVFQSWSDGGAQSHSVVVGATNVNIAGTFKTQYLLTTAVNPAGGGTVTPSAYYDAGSQVTVIALTSPGYAFSSWSGGACTGSSPLCIFNINGPATATANFTRLTYLVSINVPAGIQYTLSGFPFTGPTSLSLPAGSYSLALNSPQATSVGPLGNILSQLVFVSWSDGGLQSHDLVVTSAPVTVTGTFKTQYSLSVSATPANEGSVNPAGTGFYDAGSTPFVIALANPGYTFQFWSGACTGSSPLCFVTMDSAHTVTANFGLPLNWVQLLPAQRPPARSGHSMAFDQARGQVVLFGGTDTNNTVYFGDTWLWDGSNWTQVAIGAGPPPRSGAAMGYDPVRKQVVLFGGGNNSIVPDTDTWVWNGSTWSQVTTNTIPGAGAIERGFEAASMAWDGQELVMFGGVSSLGFQYNSIAATWAWAGNDWIQKAPASSPSPRDSFGMAFDSDLQEILVFGGEFSSDVAANAILGDTWVWNGTRWLVTAPAASPSARASGAMAYDALHRQAVLFSGYNGPADTWTFDGTNWTQKFPVTSPDPRYAAPMVYDTLHQQVILFGGYDFTTQAVNNDTWTFEAPVVNLVPQAPTVVNDGLGNYLVTATLKNQGNVPVTFMIVSSATLGGIATTGFTTPQIIAINPGATGSFTAKFPTSKFTQIPKPMPAVMFQGTYNAGAVVGAQWTASARGVTLP